MKRHRPPIPLPQQRFIPASHIEKEADILIAQYVQKQEWVAKPPVPVDDFPEPVLGLELQYANLEVQEGLADVFGAIYIPQKLILVDYSQEYVTYPKQKGRGRFTIAHELGHWVLHRYDLLANANTHHLFDTGENLPTHLCRSSQSKSWLEYQANQFAGFLLMPKQLIHDAWRAAYGDLVPVTLDTLRLRRQEILEEEAHVRGGYGNVPSNENEVLFEWACRKLASEFEVSPMAMRIRLQGMGLLAEHQEASLFG